jgi:hypothetical protein
MARILHYRTALLILLTEIRYTLSRLRAHPLGAPHVAAFEDLRAEYMEVQATDLSLLEAQADAQARVDITDESLNELATRFSRALLTLTSGNRNHATYAFYFGDKPLADFKRPILGDQLKEMSRWVAALPNADASLQAMGPELTAAVTAAQQAAEAKEQVAGQRRELREIGARRQLVDRLNGVRKEVHGALAKLPHEHTRLPTNFADQFFRRDPGRPEIEEDDSVETVEAAQARIEALRGEMTAAEARLAELLADAEAEAEAKAAKARAAQEKAIAEVDQAMADLQQKRAALIAQRDAG